jgi:hypothetical protein
MLSSAGRRPIVAVIALLLTVGLPTRLLQGASGAATATPRLSIALPDSMTSAEFWKLASEISEPGGYFQIEDNYTSNEGEVSQMYTLLRQHGSAIENSVYIGVGPEQNFSYIAATRPKMAFVIDIRRQAVMQHLMYKAMFELSSDRADFISILFSRARPAGLDSTTPMDKIWDAYWYVNSDTALQTRNYSRVYDRLTKTHGFTFNADEVRQLQAVFSAFHLFGPEISTRGAPSRGRGGGGGGNSWTFADLTGYMRDNGGRVQSFMTTEENYRFVKNLHDRNLIVPVSGDFAGPKALRAIGTWLKSNGGVVSGFYVSNVEQYLFREGKSRAFYGNVSTLPQAPTTVFIRPYSLRESRSSAWALCPISEFLRSSDAGRVPSWESAQRCGR